MSGFLGSSTALTVCVADGSRFSGDSLLKHVFSSAGVGDLRLGWVVLGDMVNVDFEPDRHVLDMGQSLCAIFSLRMDTRKASSAAVNLQFAEAVKIEEGTGKKVGKKRKKELKEEIAATLTSKAPFIPALTDCLWILDSGRLLVSTSSAKALQAVFDLFKITFGIDPAPIKPKSDMAGLFEEICRNGEYQCNGFTLSPFATATLAEGKARVTVQNNFGAMASALNEELKIQKLRLAATSMEQPDFQLDFTVDTNLAVSGLHLPKAEKGAEEVANLLLKADVCASVAGIVEALSALNS